ncbi:pentapeptide repeat-containing protein [uncultured Aquimarina sp.]|uniref:pentapeptide repeat-containing protein n=1 Tax=uncultured Aquimarina sp. TaxID=575652 RepID=UPI00262D6DDC|nr:pentapeptide repeat-containing protein [uncultured Aquimarina sp.]
MRLIHRTILIILLFPLIVLSQNVNADLIQSKLKFKNQIDTILSIDGKTFNKYVGTSGNVIVEENFSLKNSIFRDRFKFRRTKFKKGFDFSDNVYNDKFYMATVKSYHPCSLHLSTFDTIMTLDSSVLIDFNLSNSYHKGLSYIRQDSIYNGNFEHSIFYKDVDFTLTKFSGITNFQNTEFKEKVIFLNNSFYDKIIFTNSSFNNELLLDDCSLPDSLFFDGIKNIKTPIDFSYVNTEKTKNGYCNVILSGTDISKLKLSYSQFRLFFNETDRIETKKIIYERLLAVQKDNGFVEGYKILDKEYKSYKNNTDHPTFGKFYDFLDSFWWDYGYDKNRIFIWSFLLYLIFVLINTWLLYRKILFEKVLDSKKLHKLLSKKSYPTIVISLFVTGYLFFGLKFEVENLKYKNLTLTFYLFFIYITGLICIAYMANLIIKL